MSQNMLNLRDENVVKMLNWTRGFDDSYFAFIVLRHQMITWIVWLNGERAEGYERCS